jgi:LysB family phage lysis regulatory protein
MDLMLTQARLYLALGLVVAFLALAGVALWFRGEAHDARAARDKAKADLSTAVTVNHAQEATIGRLRAQAEANDRAVATLAASVAGINQSLSDQSAARAGLKGKDANVRSYLDTPVPAPLAELYNGKPAAGGAAGNHQGKGAGGAGR